MSETQEQPIVSLDIPNFSDVTIKQISKDGKVREYHAHKIVLMPNSRYFSEALASGLYDPQKTTLEVHDDDSDHFEFLLKFMYSLHYDKDTIEKLAAGDDVRRLCIPFEIYSVANKYAYPLILIPLAADIEDLFSTTEATLPGGSHTLTTLLVVVQTHYESVSSPDEPLSKILVSRILKDYPGFVSGHGFVEIVKLHPIFGSDVALRLTKEQYCVHCRFCRKPDKYTMSTLRMSLNSDGSCQKCRAPSE